MRIDKPVAMKNILLGIIILLTIMVWISSKAAAQSEKIPRGGTLKIMVVSDPSHLNPAMGGLTGSAAIPPRQIFAGLLQFDEKFQPRPYLAKKWQISSDGMTYTFHLEEKATFHDGKPITSADVAFSFETVKKNNPGVDDLFEVVEKVEIPDPHTVIFRLRHPFPAFLAAIYSSVLILPKHIYGEGEIRKHPANTKPTVGSGPFKFVEWKKGQYIILDRYENFFRKGRPYLDRIIMEFVPDETARTIALETGATHLLPPFPAPYSDVQRLGQMPHLVMTIKGLEAMGLQGILQINNRKPPLNNVKVRKAIAHSINKNSFADLFFGFAKPATAPLRYTNPFHHPNLPQYEHSPNKANQLLDEAGFKKGPDGTRFNLSIDYYPGTQSRAEFYRPQLEKAGIRATLRPSPDLATWVARVTNSDYELNVFPGNDFMDPVMTVDRAFTSKNIKKDLRMNTMGYSNPEVDRLCAEARVEMNFEKRKKLYHRVQEILMDELPVIWVVDIEYPTLYNRDFDGIPMDVWGLINPFDTVFWRKGK